ncbi:MAG: hypothetical protein ACT6S0_26840 [Roseateles sp.]|uniref:hypothetical protein n=1 Tax=Roseateles sp. TaxID=1971397 RepID=UPI004035B887
MADLHIGLFWFLFALVTLGAVAWLCGCFDARNRTWPAWSISAVQVLTAAFGVLGALLFALPKVHPVWGFAAFLVSNLAAIPFNKHQGNRWILAKERCFLVFSLIGLWNWWLGPLVLE